MHPESLKLTGVQDLSMLSQTKSLRWAIKGHCPPYIYLSLDGGQEKDFAHFQPACPPYGSKNEPINYYRLDL